VAEQTKRANVGQVAGTAALYNGNYVIGIPETSTVECFETPVLQKAKAGNTAPAADFIESGDSVGPAFGTHASVAFEGLFPKVGRIGAQTPLMNAKIGAKRVAPLRNLEVAPAAEVASAGTPRQIRAAANPPSLQSSICGSLPVLHGFRIAKALISEGVTEVGYGRLVVIGRGCPGIPVEGLERCEDALEVNGPQLSQWARQAVYEFGS
jgi:hypothetical protein